MILIILTLWCSTRAIFPEGDIWQCLQTFLMATTAEVEAKDATKHPTMHRAVPHKRECSGPNVNSANVGKLM